MALSFPLRHDLVSALTNVRVKTPETNIAVTIVQTRPLIDPRCRIRKWKNAATENVAKWLSEEPLRSAAIQFLRGYHGNMPYRDFSYAAGLRGCATPDHYAYDVDVDVPALDDVLRELRCGR